MTNGTVTVTAEAHLHICQLNALLYGALADVLNQITSDALALTDPNVWAGQAATVFATEVWPQVQSLLGQVQGSLGELQSQVSSILANVTAAGSGILTDVASAGTGTISATVYSTTQLAASL